MILQAFGQLARYLDVDPIQFCFLFLVGTFISSVCDVGLRLDPFVYKIVGYIIPLLSPLAVGHRGI